MIPDEATYRKLVSIADSAAACASQEHRNSAFELVLTDELKRLDTSESPSVAADKTAVRLTAIQQAAPAPPPVASAQRAK